MSRHKSYGKQNRGSTKRNVLTRFERIEQLKKEKSGMPKTILFSNYQKHNLMQRIQLTNNTHYKFEHNLYVKIIDTILNEIGHASSFISIHFLTSPQIKTLHLGYFQKNTSTDCITLPADHEGESGLKILGDGFLCPSHIKKNAFFYGVTFEHEIARCICHCVLHMIGYTDNTPEEREVMTEKENELLTKLNIK